jgi:hypothetical protein
LVRRRDFLAEVFCAGAGQSRLAGICRANFRALRGQAEPDNNKDSIFNQILRYTEQPVHTMLSTLTAASETAAPGGHRHADIPGKKPCTS